MTASLVAPCPGSGRQWSLPQFGHNLMLATILFNTYRKCFRIFHTEMKSRIRHDHAWGPLAVSTESTSFRSIAPQHPRLRFPQQLQYQETPWSVGADRDAPRCT